MLKNGLGIKCVGEYLTHKLIKMAKGKIVNEKVLKWKKKNYFLKKIGRERESNKAINEKELFVKICSIILPILLFQKSKNPKNFPTFALAPL